MLVSHGICNMNTQQQHPYAAAQVAEKVMRRVEIAKVNPTLLIVSPYECCGRLTGFCLRSPEIYKTV